MAPRIEPTKTPTEIFKPRVDVFKPAVREQLPVQQMPAADKPLFLRQNNIGADTLKLNLFARFDQNVVAPAQQQGPPDPKKVADAVKLIKDRLDEGFLGDVSHGDLSDIQKEIRSLTPTEATEVFRQLSNDDLKKWADELDGTLGGYSDSEKKALFDEIAGKLDGPQAARFLNALGDEKNIQAFADSVSKNASGATKAALIGQLAGQVETNRSAAIAVAELIGGMGNNPRELEGVLKDLSQPQLAAIMKAASQEEIHATPSMSPYGGGSVYTTFDPAPLVDMLNAVSKTGDAELKAKVFQAGSMELKRIEDAGGLLNPAVGKDDAARGVRNSLTNILKSDTTGIMTSLEHDFRNGDGVTAYAKSMLRSGQTAELGQIIAQLSKGNDLKGDPMARFAQQTTTRHDANPHYRNAQMLGYFAGALFAGAKQITGDRSKQADMLKNVFGTVAGATGALNPPAGIASSIVNGLTQAIVGEVTDGLNKGTMSLQEALEQLLYPRDATGDTYEGPAEADYDSAFSRVTIRG